MTPLHSRDMPPDTRLRREMRRIWSQLKKAAPRVRIGQRWSAAANRDGFTRRVYPDYDALSGRAGRAGEARSLGAVG